MYQWSESWLHNMMKLKFVQKLKIILTSLALDVEPNKCMSICSRNHINVTNGFENIPSIYKIKAKRFAQYIKGIDTICCDSHIAAIRAKIIE